MVVVLIIRKKFVCGEVGLIIDTIILNVVNERVGLMIHESTIVLLA